MFLSYPGKRNFLIFQEVTFRLLFCCFFIRYFAVATDLREVFLLSDVFYVILLLLFATVSQVLQIWENSLYPLTFFNLHSLRRFGTNCFYQPWRLQGLPLRFETQTQPISLSEPHIVQQKVLLGRFYFCIKVLQNTVSTSSRLWNHSLIATYIARYMSYLLSYRSS